MDNTIILVSELNIEQLIELQTQVNYRIRAYEDGFFYLCRVRSYGRIWEEHYNNAHTVQELCYQYGGDDGIVDVYTNNPNARIDNYGSVMYVPSKEDLKQWHSHQYLVRRIPEMEKELRDWETRGELPFSQRPHFGPHFTEEDLAEERKMLEEFDMSFTAPIHLNYHEEE